MYNTAGAVSVFSITSFGALDKGFGTSGVTSMSGSTYQYVKVLYGLSVQSDGKLVAVGYNNPSNDGVTFDPSLVRFFGYQYIPQYAQSPNRVDAGQLDTTLWSTTGVFALNNTTNAIFNNHLSGYTVKHIYESGNGLMTFVADNGNNTIIFQLLKDLSLNPLFNSGGYRRFADNAHGSTTGFYVNSYGNFYITGNYSGASWAVGLSSTGAPLYPAFSPSQNLNSSYAISLQSSQQSARVILGGQGSVGTGQSNSHGYLLGYTSSGALDTNFGTSGQVDMGVSTAITDVTVDADNQIVAVSNNTGSVILQRVSATGSAITTLSGGTAISNAVSGSVIKVVLDNGGRIVVAAATSTGYILRSYNNDTTGTNIDSVSISPTGGGMFVLSRIYATSDDKITLAGYESVSGKVVIARFTSVAGSLSLDSSSFDVVGSQSGILYTTIGSLNQYNDGIINADDRIMVAGVNTSSPDACMVRAFGYPYATYVNQGPDVSQNAAGTLNTTFGNTSPTNGTYNLSTLNALLSNAQGKAITPLSNTGYFIALDRANSGSNSILIKTLSTGALDTTYNNGYAGVIPGIAGSGSSPVYMPLGVTNLLLDGSNNVVLVGATGGAAWVKRYTSTGAADTSFNTAITTALSSNLSNPINATAVVEQTLGRLVVAGKSSTGKAALFAFKSLAPNGSAGSLDTTFNNTGAQPGTYNTGISGTIYRSI